MSQWVMGVDARPGGWAGIAESGREVVGLFAATIERLIDQASAEGQVGVVAIDIPIGLPDTGPRRADVLARAAAGERRASIFFTPIRPALAASTYAEALEISRAVTGCGLSAQAYGLRAKALAVDAFARTTDARLVEVHPEVSFAAMHGGPLPWSKKRWPGMELRRRLLSDEGIEIPVDLGELGRRANVDDILDAAAAAWTARRDLVGTARSLPDPPEVFSDGWPAAIWY